MDGLAIPPIDDALLLARPRGLAEMASAGRTQPRGSLSTEDEARLRERARATAEDFESVFIAQLVETMWEGVESEAPFGGGQGEKVFRSMLNENYAKDIAKTGGIGLADQVYREILTMQGLAPEPVHGLKEGR